MEAQCSREQPNMRLKSHSTLKKTLLLFCAMCFFHQANSQTGGALYESLAKRLNQAIAARKPGYEVQMNPLPLIFDSVKGQRANTINGFFEDTRNNFNGTIFFLAAPDKNNPLRNKSSNSLFLGYLTADSMNWISASPMNGWFGEISAFMDLNGDGYQEIICITSEGTRPTPEMEYLWIFSWNGKCWHRANQVDENGKSTICNYEAFFELRGPDDSGRFDIFSSGQDAEKTYRWNGHEFAQVSE